MSVRMAILGPKDIILPFKGIGVDAFEVDRDTVREKLKSLTKDYGIIFVLEDYVPFIKDLIEKFSEYTLPAIVPIPSPGIEKSYAIERLNDLIKKAVGVEIYRED